MAELAARFRLLLNPDGIHVVGLIFSHIALH